MDYSADLDFYHDVPAQHQRCQAESGLQAMYFRGVTYLVLAGVFLSTSGIFVRSLQSEDPWIILLYRSLAFSATVLLFMKFSGRAGLTARFKTMQPRDAIVSISLGLGFILYLLSLYHTTVANTVFILSAGPFVAALLGWLVLSERVSGLTWLAMTIASVGIAIMVSDGLRGDHRTGILLAFGAVATFALMIVVMRSSASERDLLPATFFGGIIAALICLPMIEQFAISRWDLFLAICLGVIQIGAGFILVTLGTRYVPAAQVPLLTLSETALAPIWVWLLVNEIPAKSTLIGGAIVLTAVILQGLGGVRSARRSEID